MRTIWAGRGITAVVLGLLSGIFIQGCSFMDQREWTTQDSWYRPAWEIEMGAVVAREKVVPVSDGQEAAAEKRLAADSFVAVTAEEAAA